MSLRPSIQVFFAFQRCAYDIISRNRNVSGARRSLLASICLISLSTSGILSGKEAIQFANLSATDGLPLGGVLSVAEDTTGLVWLGTRDGLRRFDGYEMTSLGAISQRPVNSITPKLVVEALLRLGSTGFLVSTDTDVRQFDLVEEVRGSSAVLSERASALLQVPGEDRFFIGTPRGLYTWTPSESQPVLEQEGLAVTSLGLLEEEGGSHSALVFGTSSGAVWRWDWQGSEPAKVWWSCESSITALQGTRDGHLWVGTAEQGIFRLAKGGVIEEYTNRPDSASRIPSNQVTCFLEDSSGRLWVGTKHGLCRFNGSRYGFSVYQHDPSDQRSLGNDQVACLYEDRHHVLWVSHRLGVSRFGLNETWFSQYRHRVSDGLSLGHDAVFGMECTDDGTLWVGTAAGVYGFDRAAEGGRQRTESLSALESASLNVSKLVSDGAGGLWIGTWDNGLHHWQPRTQQLTNYSSDPNIEDSLPANSVTDLAVDTGGTLWVGTRRGLARGIPGIGFQTLRHDPIKADSLRGDVVTALFSSGASMYVGTEQGGLQVIDDKAVGGFRELPPSLQNSVVSVMGEGPDDLLWIGTRGKGVFVYEPETEEVRHYHVDNSGLPDNELRGILTDAKGAVWLTTGNGLARYASGTFRTFDRDDGLATVAFHPHAYAQDDSGHLYVGGNEGFAEIQIDGLPADQKIASQTVLTSLAINGQRVTPSKDNPYLKKPLGLTKVIPLPYDHGSRVSITLGTLDYTRPARNHFRYRLAPLEREWSSAGKDRRATYTSLRPGSYRLLAQSSLDGERWNENSAEIDIEVLPPWYLTWWCLLGAVLGLIGVIGVVMLRLSSSRHRRILRQQEVLENERNRAEAALAEELQRTMVLTSASDGDVEYEQYGKTLERILAYFDAVYGAIYQTQAETDSISLVGEIIKKTDSAAKPAADQELLSSFLAAGKSVVVSSVREDQRVESWRDRLLDAGIEAVLILPTEYWGKGNGLIMVGAGTETYWRVEDIELMVKVASQVGRAMAHHQLILTEQHHKQALEKARATAEQANQAKSDFLAKMTHELRTPLNSIIGFTQLLEEDTGMAPDHRRTISIINASGNHLLETVNGILDMSKIEQGQVELNSEPFDLDPFVKEVIVMMRGRAEASNLTLSEERCTTLPSRIAADKVKLRQVLINFIGNAIKFTETGGITLRLRSLGVAEETTMGFKRPLRLQFEIADTGCGVSEDELDRLFERFAQTASGKQSGQGTGLGLPISKSFIELMGGSVSVHSKRHEGTTFTFDVVCDELPLAEQPASAKERFTGVPLLQDGTPPFRVLIAEDQLPNRILLRTLLGKAGFEVIEAENGKQAVEKWREMKPDLTFMDNDMPLMTGLEATRVIMSECSPDDPHKIIFLSAYAIESYRQEALKAGCIDYLTKPFDKQDLFEMMAKHTQLAFH